MDLVVEAGVDGAFDASGDATQPETLRQEGNEAFKQRDFESAKELYSRAIALDPSNHLLFGNRSAACYQLKHFTESLQDANRAIELSADWAKGYLRKATACESLGELQEAVNAYNKVLQVEKDPSSSEANKAAARLKILKSKSAGHKAVKKGFLSGNAAKSAIYCEKEELEQDAAKRSWKSMLKKLLDGCNKRGVNSRGQSVVLDDGVFAKLLQESEFQRIIYPGIPKEQLVHAPKNLQTLLEDPWYEQELLALMPKVQAKAVSVLTNVKKRGAEQGEVMDPATEQMLMPQVLQEAFGREVLAMVHRVNYQKHVKLANDARLLADPNSEFATWDQLDEDFLDELLQERSEVRGVAVMDEFMGEEWTQLLQNDVFRMAKNGLLMSAAPDVDAKHVLSRSNGGNQPETLPGAKLRFVEHHDCTTEYPALAELIEKLHAVPYEINSKRPDTAKLCAQFVHCTAVQQLQAGHHQPLRLDCGAGDKENGFKLTCVYFFNAVEPSTAEQQKTTLTLRTSLAENAPIRQVAPASDRLVVFKSQSVLNEVTAVPAGEDLFYLTFWIHGQALE
jgi:Tfp pilus assembly protein PilF